MHVDRFCSGTVLITPLGVTPHVLRNAAETMDGCGTVLVKLGAFGRRRNRDPRLLWFGDH